MCQRIQCSTCKRPTYAGCGAHIEQVLADVPAAKRCGCRAAGAKVAQNNTPNSSRGWLRDLLGK